jgi:elongation factor G
MHLLLAGLQVPPPVFFCSIEVTSQSEENRLSFALKCLQREDPTLRVISNDEETLGQTIIQGMGELHLDIIKERMKKEYGLNVFFGPLEIAYKEMPTVEVDERLNIEKTINSKKNVVEIEFKLIPKKDHVFTSVKIIRTEENQFSELTSEQLDAINHGVKSAFNAGILLNFPVIDTEVHLTNLICSRSTLVPFLSTASNQCIKKALKNASCIILQPIMNLEITTQNEYASKVQQDLMKRNSFDTKTDISSQITVINSKTPLAQLRTYSSDLRRITSGHTTFSIEFESYEQMTQKEYQELYTKLYK